MFDEDPKWGDEIKVLEQYADIKSKIKFLEEELEELKPQVAEVISETGTTHRELPGRGTFSLMSRTTWQYSDKLTKKMDIIKKEQKLEQMKRIAVPKSISQSIVWKPKK